MNCMRCFVTAIFCGFVAFTTVADAALSVTADAEKVTVTAPAGALDTSYDGLKLYLVWDSVDHGSRIEDWPSANRIVYEGTLSSDAASYEISRASVPALNTMRVIAVHDVDDVNDSANWACTNSAGVEVSGAVPDDSTRVVMDVTVQGATSWRRAFPSVSPANTIRPCSRSVM